MIPAVGAEAVDDPYHRHRLEIPGHEDPTEVVHGPSYRFGQIGDCLLGTRILAADEHVGRTIRKRGIHHVRVADDVERFDHLRVRQQTLDLLPTRIVSSNGEAGWDAAREVEGIGGVNDDLAGDRLGVRQTDGVLGSILERGQDEQLAERCGFGKGSGGRAALRFRKPSWIFWESGSRVPSFTS